MTRISAQLNTTPLNGETSSAAKKSGIPLGPAHQDEIFTNTNLGTCMDYTNSPSTNQHPNQHDYDQLVTIYSHLHSSTTIGSTPSGQSQSVVGNDPSSWGRLVSGSHASGQSTYARDFGHGNLIVTHVTWAWLFAATVGLVEVGNSATTLIGGDALRHTDRRSVGTSADLRTLVAKPGHALVDGQDGRVMWQQHDRIGF